MKTTFILFFNIQNWKYEHGDVTKGAYGWKGKDSVVHMDDWQSSPLPSGFQVSLFNWMLKIYSKKNQSNKKLLNLFSAYFQKAGHN